MRIDATRLESAARGIRYAGVTHCCPKPHTTQLVLLKNTNNLRFVSTSPTVATTLFYQSGDANVMRNRKKPSTQECDEARARRKRKLKSSRDVTKHAYSRLGDTGGARALTDFHIYTANSCTRASASYEAALRQTLAQLIQFIFTEQTHDAYYTPRIRKELYLCKRLHSDDR